MLCGTLVRLTSHRVGQAFALARLAAPQLSFDEWQGYALGLLSPRSGKIGAILAIEAPSGYLQGIAGFHLEHDARGDCLLIVDHFAAFGIVAPAGVAQTLTSGLRAYAFASRCQAIQLRLPASANAACRAWLSSIAGPIRRCAPLRSSALVAVSA